MMRLLVVNDPHCSDRPPLGRLPGYTDQILGKLVEVGCIAEQYRCSYVLIPGDLFHVKRPHYVSHALVGRLIRIFQAYPHPPIVVLGNHDLSEAGLDGVARQPIAVLEEAGAVQIVHEGMPVLLGEVGETTPVAVVGRPFTAAGDADPDYYALRDDERELLARMHVPVVMLVHGSIVPSGETRPYPTVSLDFIDLTGIDLLFCGHIHENLGLHQMRSGTYFANFGSIGRIARTADSMTREVVALMVTVEENGPDFAEIPLQSVLPASEVFIQGEEALLDPDAFGAAEFADHIMSALAMEEMPVAELLAAYAGDAPPEVRARLEYYLTRAGL